ncbi:hypothetical protein Bhyg_14228 [Pseudolycoriella hygida]|uniref:Protein sleepless n=1 Tax=Pseudolycoriella hygida TaxID=35572 RepID=A0A9Q0MPI8_9DIPT|nr:hypothetical protein Bhyg_14228 [Pseudolycoriella hygida]
MDSKMFVLTIFALFCMMQSSYALKCFICESNSNPRCVDSSVKNLQPQECVTENMLSYGSGFFSQFGVGPNSNPGKEPLTPTCFKFVTRNGTGHSVARRCAVKYQNQDPCATARSTLQQTPTLQFEYCGTCDKDGCNTGNSLQFIFGLTAFAAVVSTARMFA